MFLSPKDDVLEFGFMPGQTVVDMGAGSGHYTLALGRILGSNSSIIAVDIQEDPLVRLKREAQEKGLNNIEVICGDIEKFSGTSLSPSIADGVLISNTLFQLEDKAAAVSEIDRILKKKGRVAIVEWVDKLEREEVRKLFEEKGFSFERGFDAGDHHYILIFKK